MGGGGKSTRGEGAGHGVVVGSGLAGSFLSGLGVTGTCGGAGRRRGSQAYLGPRALAAPGDMMIDWVSPRLRGMRPLSLFRPSA